LFLLTDYEAEYTFRNIEPQRTTGRSISKIGNN